MRQFFTIATNASLELIRQHELPVKVLLGTWLSAEVSNHAGCPWLDEPIPAATLEMNTAENEAELEAVVHSGIHLVQGSLGMARKWPKKGICLHEKGHRWLDEEELAELEARYQHPLARTLGDLAKRVGGHGGMDFIMDYRLIYCLKNGLPLDQDVYDAAAWSCVVPLSIASVADRSASLDVPDFTRGQWKTPRQLLAASEV